MVKNLLLSVSLYLCLIANTVAEHYTIDAGLSKVIILVYRDGYLSGLGHNHLVTSYDLSGTVEIDDKLSDKIAFNISMPLTKLVVDDKQERIAFGGDFDGEVASEDIKATRKNMLGEDVLDAETYPTVRIESLNVTGNAPQFNANFNVYLHGKMKTISAPIEAQQEGEWIFAKTRFTIKQSDFLIEPLSIMFGAIAVQDNVEIIAEIKAKK